MNLDFSPLEELVPRRLRELDGASISIGVSVGGKTVYEQSFGYADKAAQRLATPDTPYSVASVSKPVLGTGLTILLQEGKIDLHAPLNRYLTGSQLRALEGDAGGATIARLANHTAGLPTHYQFITENPAPSGEETLSRYGCLTRPAGEASVYANLGFGFLGTAIENVSDLPLVEFFRARVFEPLGMANSLLLAEIVDPSGAALRYDGEGKALPPYVTVHPGASDVYTSVRDLLRFGESHFGHMSSPILSQEWIHRMQEPTGSQPIEQGFGITWARRKTVSGDRIIIHTGGMAGVSTRLVVIPARQLVFTVLCNFESPLDDEVFDVLYKATDVEVTSNPDNGAPAPFPSDAVGTWRGKIFTYAGDVPIGLVVKPDGVVTAEGAESDVKFEDNQIVGSIDARIPTPDAERIDHKMALDLQYRGDRLTGSVSVLTVDGVRIRNRIAYPARLTPAPRSG